jgi:hypothetical protein
MGSSAACAVIYVAIRLDCCNAQLGENDEVSFLRRCIDSIMSTRRML